MKTERGLITRRRAIGVAAAGAAGAGFWAWTRGPSPAPVAKPAAPSLLTLSADESLAYAAERLRAGAFPDLLREAYTAPVTTGADRGDLHALFVVPALVELARPFRTEAQQLAALWCAHNTAMWLIDPEPPQPLSGPAPTLAEAMSRFDPGGAERAVAAMPVADAAAALAPWALRTHIDPHRVVHLAASTSPSTPVDEPSGRLSMRSVARRLAVLGRGEPGALFRSLWGARRALPRGRAGLDEGAANEALAWARAGGEVEAARSALVSGQQPRALWAALVVAALEVVGAAPTSSGMGVHTLTLLDAAATLAERHPDPRTRTLLLLLAGRWVGDLRAMHDEGALDLFDVTRGAAPFESMDALVGAEDAPARAASWLVEGGDPRALLAWTRDQIVGRTDELHDYKYLAALPRVLARVPQAWRIPSTALSVAAPVVQRPSVWASRPAALAALKAVGG